MVTTAKPITMLADREQTFTMTYDEWRTFVAESAHSEWANGEVIVFMSPKEKHQLVLQFLSVLIGNFVALFSLGAILFAPYEMRAVPGGSASEPDLLFIASEHLDRVTENGLAGPADLLIEIISPESRARDRSDKFYEYQDAGVPEYWLFDPRSGRERSDFYQLNAQGQYVAVLPDADGRCHSAVLPGFWLDPNWLWQETLPSPLGLLSVIVPGSIQVNRPPATD